MGYWFKHMAVRLWTALMIGSLVALVTLPPVAGLLGPGWMILPGLGLFVVAYWLTGMVFGTMGRRRLERLLGEAAVWDRAGMDREARQALVRAAATVDSFFFSPLSRKAPTGRLLAQMGRFHLAQAAPESSSDAVIGAYLNHFPRDRDAAVRWLDGVLAGRPLTKTSPDIAARIGVAHPEDAAIQRMLAQFYLRERRCDFAALQTYRQLMDSAEPLTDDLLGDIVDLFLAQPRVDNLALKVYLYAYERGQRDDSLLAAIKACCQMIHPSPETQSLLERAKLVLKDVDPVRLSDMASVLMADLSDAGPQRPSERSRRVQPAIGPLARKAFIGIKGWIAESALGAFNLSKKIRMASSSRRAKSVLKWAVMGLLVIIVGGLVSLAG